MLEDLMNTIQVGDHQWRIKKDILAPPPTFKWDFKEKRFKLEGESLFEKIFINH